MTAGSANGDDGEGLTVVVEPAGEVPSPVTVVTRARLTSTTATTPLAMTRAATATAATINHSSERRGGTG